MNIKKLKEIEKAVSELGAEKIPDGWYTRQEIAKALNRSQARADELICDMVKHKLMERKEFKVRTNAGVRRIPHFSF